MLALLNKRDKFESVITKKDICIYATIKGAETTKATQIRLFGVKIAQFRSDAPKLYSTVTRENVNGNTSNMR